MSLAIATAVGAMFSLGTFLLLRDNVVHIVWGLAIISQAANVYLISMGGVREGTHDTVPVLTAHAGPFPATADPLVQALVLTAIVISFGMTAFALVLSYRAYQENESMDVTEWS
ncbi:MAG: sodium:proton antiporter [Halobacteriota archaeon]